MTGPRVWNFKDLACPAGAVNIMRGTPYGNRFVIGRDGLRADVIRKFGIHQLPELRRSGALKALAGKDLACCKPLACHGDILIAAANPLYYECWSLEEAEQLDLGELLEGNRDARDDVPKPAWPGNRTDTYVHGWCAGARDRGILTREETPWLNELARQHVARTKVS